MIASSVQWLLGFAKLFFFIGFDISYYLNVAKKGHG
jgi:hypothetical protein